MEHQACLSCPFKSTAAKTLSIDELNVLGDNCAQALFQILLLLLKLIFA